MRRREFLAATAAATLLAAAPPVLAAATPRPFVTTDIARLRRVLVHRPAARTQPVGFATGEFPFRDIVLPEGAIRGHQALEQLLAASGAEVVHLTALLDEAIESARRRGAFDTWLRATYPRLAPEARQVTGAWLTGDAPEVRYQVDADGNYRHLVDSLGGGTFVRDFGVMTPRGLVVCNFYGLWRRPQARLMRFIVDFAPSMAGYPVVFDGAEDNLLLEGGDLQVLDERTLLVGHGNRTDPRVPRRLAQRLDMDVIGVQTRKVDALRFAPGEGGYTDDLRGIFLHLDTCLTRVADRRFVALPWFLEAEYAGKDPFTRFWRGTLGESAMDEKKIKDVLEYLPDLGRIRRFAAGTGEEDASVKGLKIVDWLRGQGFEVSYVGGPPPAEPSIAHLFDQVLAEHQRQAANVVATAPGKVLAYDGAPATHAALRAAGVEVKTFPGEDLARWNGGPHCLTLPLERG